MDRTSVNISVPQWIGVHKTKKEIFDNRLEGGI